jgi:hypothetical protein
MAANCTNFDQIRDVSPSAEGCEECLQMGDSSAGVQAIIGSPRRALPFVVPRTVPSAGCSGPTPVSRTPPPT